MHTIGISPESVKSPPGLRFFLTTWKQERFFRNHWCYPMRDDCAQRLMAAIRFQLPALEGACGHFGRSLVVFILGLLCAGCTSRMVYKARALPVEFQPPPVTDIRDVALPQLASDQGPSDVIMPGDLLEVSVLTSLDTKDTAISCRVDDEGNIQVPPIGKVTVGGMRFPDAERAIAQAAIERDVYRRPTVTIKRVQSRTYRITVTGAVAKPGVYNIPAAQADLLTALVQAEGLKPDADPVVEIRRSGSAGSVGPAVASKVGNAPGQLTSFTEPVAPGESLKVDLRSAGQDNQSLQEYRLEDGDVVFVPPRKLDPIYVDGLVNKPGMYAFPASQDLRLMDVIALAGGCSNPLADKVWIVRQIRGRSEPVLIRANLRTAAKNPAENLRIAPGDVITVEETFGTFIYNLLKGFVHVGGTVPLN